MSDEAGIKAELEASSQRTNELVEILRHVSQWMYMHALPKLGDDCDGGNALYAEIEAVLGSDL